MIYTVYFTSIACPGGSQFWKQCTSKAAADREIRYLVKQMDITLVTLDIRPVK